MCRFKFLSQDRINLVRVVLNQTLWYELVGNMMPEDRKTLLIFSQVFIPDPASVGQHIADVAIEMARRGHRVIVYCSARGYENPSLKYPARENIKGVEVRRLPLGSFGKKSIMLRVAGTASFMLQCFAVCLVVPGVDGIFFSTSPPLIGTMVSVVSALRRIPIAYWAMDLNPDQLIALGSIPPRGIVARVLEAANHLVLMRSTLVIALDRFMAGRLEARGAIEGKMLVIPPWPHEGDKEAVEPTSDIQSNPFAKRHGLIGKFVVMYSGNHSPSNPLATVLDAAVRLKDDPDVRFVFVGGGSGKKEIERYIREGQVSNVLSLPYQPLADLRHSLSAANVHVVSLGEQMAGIIHPCKIYGAMAVGRPILYLGPRPSHITDLLDRFPVGIHVPHGDVNAALDAIRKFQKMDSATLEKISSIERSALDRELSHALLCGRLCDSIERVLSTAISA